MRAARHLYLHGFGSDRHSDKGVELRRRLAAARIDLELLDLNVPSFETQTYSAILNHLDDVDRSTPSGTRLRLGGSSMGGYLAARFTELHPRRVERLFLLCPGFDLTARWPLLLGHDAFARWEQEGTLPIEGAGLSRPLHWRFVEDSREHPAYPEVGCPTLIFHGVQDEIVPIECSRRYAAGRDNVRLIELDDDHRLLDSVDRIARELLGFLGP